MARLARLAIAATAALLVTAGAVASAEATPVAAGARSNTTCGQILPVGRLNQALFGSTGAAVGRYSSVKVYKTRSWYYPYNRKEAQTGSQCFYDWSAADVPADYAAAFAPSGPAPGTVMLVGFGLSKKSFEKGRTATQNDGTGEPEAYHAGGVRSLSFGHEAKAAYLEDEVSGTGPTYNGLAIYVLTRHDNYFAISSWDASLTQLKTVAQTVLASRAGGF